jgi:hypothetical protein
MTKDQALLDILGGLLARIEALEASALHYKGVWSPASTYARGDAVTHAGSMWVVGGATTAKPGEGPDWRLAVKRGRDGKGA